MKGKISKSTAEKMIKNMGRMKKPNMMKNQINGIKGKPSKALAPYLDKNSAYSKAMKAGTLGRGFGGPDPKGMMKNKITNSKNK